MPVLRRATDQQQNEWLPMPTGVWRFHVTVPPEIKMNENFGKYQVKFSLALTPAEVTRLKAEVGDPPEGVQQSYRTNYTPNLSLGFMDKIGQFRSTKLVDFLATSLGQTNTKKFREWIAAGGGPPRPEDPNDDKAEIALITEWLRWWEGSEVYGTITHRTGKDGTVWADFAGPIAVGALPGQKDDDYQTYGRGKLRAIIAESHPELEAPVASAASVVAVVDRPPAQRFTQDGAEVQGDGSAELPF